MILNYIFHLHDNYLINKSDVFWNNRKLRASDKTNPHIHDYKQNRQGRVCGKTNPQGIINK